MFLFWFTDSKSLKLFLKPSTCRKNATSLFPEIMNSGLTELLERLSLFELLVSLGGE